MTIPITRSTVNMQALCWVSRGRELFCGNKQRRKEEREVSTWLAHGGSKIDVKDGKEGGRE